MFRIIDEGIKIRKNGEVIILHDIEVSRCISKCPAVMFATNRTVSVIGRIRLLTISIKTMMGIRGDGDPIGTM